MAESGPVGLAWPVVAADISLPPLYNSSSGSPYVQWSLLTDSHTHRKFLQVSSLQGLVEMFGDLLPGGKPVVPLLLPGDMVVLPVGAGEGSPHLGIMNHEARTW